MFSARFSLLLLLMLASSAAMADDTVGSAPRLIGQIDYRFVGHLEQTDAAGRLLVWEAEFDGDLAGTMKWWFVMPPPVAEVATSDARISYYAARWELWSDQGLLLAGTSTGKTVFRNGEDGLWDGHGTVTEAADAYRSLVGRSIYETGPVIVGAEPPVTFSGTGLFAVY